MHRRSSSGDMRKYLLPSKAVSDYSESDDDSVKDKTFTPEQGLSDTESADTDTVSSNNDASIASTSTSTIYSGASLKKKRTSGSKVTEKYTKYFSIVRISGGDKSAHCKICEKFNGIKKPIKMKDSNTSGLKRHLQYKHPTEYKRVFQPESLPVHLNTLPRMFQQVSTSNKC